MNTITLLREKRLVLAVTGSIAVYKAVDLASKLTQTGARVDVMMTESARRFVNPLTFQGVTGRPVYTDMWQTEGGGGLPTHIAHVGLGETAELLLVAPATANTLAKLAHGMADNMLTVTALAMRSPLMVAPTMDGDMYEHPATQANLATLRERGVYVIEPDTGRFASGMVGKGRLPDTTTLIGHVRRVIGRKGVLAGRKVVVTAGGTREYLDPVRYITNRSSGRQGYAIAQAAIDAGADVTLITSTDALPAPVGAKVIYVDTASAMLDSVLQHGIDETDILVMAAAVADFRPATTAAHKIKKQADSDETLALNLSRNPDILLQVKEAREKYHYPRIVVGFAAESENVVANAQKKLESKGLDLLVANDITAEDSGFASENNRVIIMGRRGGHETPGLISKAEVGELIVKRIAALMKK